MFENTAPITKKIRKRRCHRMVRAHDTTSRFHGNAVMIYTREAEAQIIYVILIKMMVTYRHIFELIWLLSHFATPPIVFPQARAFE